MRHSIGRKVAILLSGSVVAQALPILAAPLLTRLYTPDSFGEFGVFTAAATILASLANMKYEHALLLVKRQATALHLLVICLLSSMAFALLLTLLVFATPSAIWSALGFGHDSTVFAYLPVSFMLAAVMQSLSAMFFRHEQFSLVAKARVIQAVITTFLSLALGAWMPVGGVLVASTLVGQCVGVAALVVLRQRIGPVPIRRRLLLACASRFRRFPMFTAPSDLLNALGANIPVLFIGSIYGAAAAGAYAMAQRILGAPLMLIGSAFSDAYRQSAAKSVSSDGTYWEVALRTIRILGVIALVPAIICLVYARDLFPWIFGQKWALSGALVQVLGVVYFLRFVVSPLSYNYYLAQRHSEDLMLQCASFASTICIFLLAQSHGVGLMSVLLTYTAIYSSVYLIYGARSMYFARMSLNNKLPLISEVTAR
jgi:O-antigen/teichoic acid export membrane protein